MPSSVKSLSTSDWAVLAFLSEQAAHGFLLATVFAKDGELGVVWTLQRPQVYRAIEHLEARTLISAIKREAGDNGPPRTLYALTELGQLTLREWLKTPVQHLRDGRSALLLKLIFTERQQSNPEPLLQAQHRHFSSILHAYEAKLRGAAGPERVAIEWRIASAQGALRFLESNLSNLTAPH